MKITMIASWQRQKRVAILLGLLVCPISGLRAQETPLTVEETLGAVFLLSPESSAFANPNAKPHLYRLLDQKEAEAYHWKVYLMIGHIGSAIDATNLELRLRSTYEGTLNAAEWRAVESVFWSLSTMARRGVTNATAIIERMTTQEYWKDIQIRSVEGVNYPHGLVNEMTISALLAYARSGAEDWLQKAQAFKNGIADPTIRSTIEWRLDPIRIAQHVKEFREKKAQPISPETRKLLSRAFNGDFNKPGLAPIEVLRGTNDLQSAGAGNLGSNAPQTIQASDLVALSTEAQDAFTRIMENFLSDRYEQCAKTLADNGKPILPLEKQNEAAIAATVQKLKAMTRDMQATKKLLGELKAQGIDLGEAQGETFPDGKVVLRIPCLGSSETKRRHLAQHHETRTTDFQDQLVIYMIKQNGQWYWNPFGW